MYSFDTQFEFDAESDGRIDDGHKRCPECERPNQFGELCDSCRREQEAERA